MKTVVKKVLIIIGVLFLIGNTFLMYSTFLMAYFKNYRQCISINNYGEAHVEFVLIPMFLVIGLWAVYQLMFKVTSKKDE